MHSQESCVKACPSALATTIVGITSLNYHALCMAVGAPRYAECQHLGQVEEPLETQKRSGVPAVKLWAANLEAIGWR
eukprot:5814595-Amphidinium_carterae.3